MTMQPLPKMSYLTYNEICSLICQNFAYELKKILIFFSCNVLIVATNTNIISNRA
jgi:hypothetical protein